MKIKNNYGNWITAWTSPLVLALLVTNSSFAQTNEPSVVEVRRYPAIFEALTGVSAKRAELTDFFNANAAKFPQQGNLDEVTTSFMVGIISYSSLFCRQMATDEAKRSVDQRWVYGAVDFSRDSTQLLNSGTLPKVLDAMANQFWGRPLTTDEMTDFQEEVSSWVSGADGSASTFKTSLNDTLTSTCSIFLAAAPIWMELK